MMLRREIEVFIREHPYTTAEILNSTKEGKKAINTMNEHNEMFGEGE